MELNLRKIKPTKIIGLGLSYKISYPDGNYPKEPILFLKGPNTLVYNKSVVIYPKNINTMWMEGELAIIMDKDNQIKGYTLANDITAENLYCRDHHLARSKSFNSFCPIGPDIVKDIDANNLHIRSYLNGKLVQDWNTNGNIFKVDVIISMISRIMTLKKDDIILTGTHPVGVMEYGKVHVGDTMQIECEEIGILENRVIGENCV